MASSGSVANASKIQMDYMNLLVTQLKNQNPLEPMDNNQMTAQIAQLSQLQQLENLSKDFSKVLATSQMSYAASLIGKKVSFLQQQNDGSVAEVEGKVEKIYNDPKNGILLQIGQELIGLDGIVSVKQ